MRIVAVLFFVSTVLAQDAKQTLRVYDFGAFVPVPRPEPTRDFESEDAVFTMVGPEVRRREVSEATFIPEDEVTAKAVSQGLSELIGSVARQANVWVAGKHLMIEAVPEDHERIKQLLDGLAGSGEPFEIEVTHIAIPSKLVNAAMRGLLLGAQRGHLDERVRKTLLDADVNKGARRATVVAASGRWTQYRSVRRMTYVPDFDVEIAQAAAIADPAPCVASEGIKAAVRPLALQDGRCLLRVYASAGDLDPRMRLFDMRAPERETTLRLRNTDFGVLEQSDFRGCGVSTEMVLKPGATAGVLAGYSGGRQHLLLFRLKSAPPPPVAGTLAVVPSGSLASFDMYHAFSTYSADEILLAIAGEGERLSRKNLTGMLRGQIADDSSFVHWASWLRGGASVVRASKAGCAKVIEAQKRLENAMIVPVGIEMSLSTGGGFAGPVVTGRPAAFGAFHRLDYVGDYDVEVAQESRIADPTHSVAYAGIFANVSVQQAGDGYLVRMDLRLQGMPEGIRTVDSSAGGVPDAQSVPVVRALTRLRVRLKSGQSRTVDLGRNPFGDGRIKATLAIPR